jgi:hypothetical protein
MVYFWNGFKRMHTLDLEKSLQRLTWSESLANKIPWEKEAIDEKAVYAVLKATVLRNLGRTKDARQVLEDNILRHDKSVFKGGYRDNWTCPVAHYEMGVSYWNDFARTSGEEDLDMCLKYLDIVSSWESFDLDARLGVRIKTGQNTVKSMRESLHWA